MFRAIIFTMLFLWAVPCAALAYQDRNISTSEPLETFDTQHFRIIYQAPLAEAAPKVAEYCEEAYQVLTQIFGWVPQGKIDVLIEKIDTTISDKPPVKGGGKRGRKK